MNYQHFVMGDLHVNTFLVWSGNEAGVVDPGGPIEPLMSEIAQHQLELKWIVNTHGHADHIIGNADLQRRTGAPIIIHQADRRMLTSATANLSAFIGEEFTSPDAAVTVKEGDRLTLGDESFLVIETPGHTAGSISLYQPGLLFSGDALFRESIGRTDFPGGNLEQLLTAIKERLLVLPPETVVWPGHEKSTTIGHEIEFNPYF